MEWNITGDLDAYTAEAGAFLHADPVENTVALSVVDVLRTRGIDAFGAGPLFGWWRPDGDVRGMFLLTGDYPVLLSAMPGHAAAGLAAVLADRRVAVPGVNAAEPTARAFATGWTRHTGMAAEDKMRQRLFRLDRLRPPDPVPRGTPRVATRADRDLVRAWFIAFEDEAQGAGRVTDTLIDDRIGYGGVLLWETHGTPVALAGRTRVAGGTARLGPVYTPPDHRCHGYGGAVTAAATRSALDAGAEHVVLFTDLSNPASNHVYQRLGYRPVSDRLMVGFSR
jgi:RimJ/RimL family protein N-acetyltransferase